MKTKAPAASAAPAPVVLSPTTPGKSAQKFKALRFPTLLNFQNEWLSYDDSAYLPIEDETIAARVKEFLEAAKVAKVEERKSKDDNGNSKVSRKNVLLPFNPKPKDISEVYAMLKHDCHVPHNTMSPPTWLDGGTGIYAGLDKKNLISCRNGLLDIENRTLYPATSAFFTRTALAIDYDANAPEPTLWLEFLDQVTNHRPELVDLLQEMMGYLISTDTSMQRVFFLWGRPRSGKGTILRVVTALIGKHNTRFPSIETLAGRFGYQNLIGASLAQITDMDCDNRQALGTAATRINAISGEDGITAERKGVTDWNGELAVRFLLAGNGLPDFGSHTAAMATRLLIAPFDRSFKDHEDRDLTEKLFAELPGILNFSLDGLTQLRERGDFVEPAASGSAKLRMIYQSDPIHGFVEEHCTVKTGAGVDKAVLYDAFQSYCMATGSHAVAMNKFSEKLASAYPSIAATKRSGERGSVDKRVPCFGGIRLNDAAAVKTYKLNHDLIQLGFPPREAFERDKAGWPVAAAAFD